MTDGAFHGGEPRGQLSIDCSPIVHGPFAALSERRWPCESDHRDATAALESNRAREGVPGALSGALGSGGEALDPGLEKAVKQIRRILHNGPSLGASGDKLGRFLQTRT